MLHKYDSRTATWCTFIDRKTLSDDEYDSAEDGYDSVDEDCGAPILDYSKSVSPESNWLDKPCNTEATCGSCHYISCRFIHSQKVMASRKAAGIDDLRSEALPPMAGATALPAFSAPSLLAIAEKSSDKTTLIIDEMPQPTLAQSHQSGSFFGFPPTSRGSYTPVPSAKQRYADMPSSPCTPGEEASRLSNAIFWFLIFCAFYS